MDCGIMFSFQSVLYIRRALAEGASVTEACYESGFKDYAHFIKSFTKTFGCSPKQYGKNDASISKDGYNRSFAPTKKKKLKLQG